MKTTHTPSTSPIIKGLNDAQKKAVITTDGRILVLAGAGSGKTKVLTHRIAYLIKEKGVQPEEILGLTFTNKAAGEMRERAAKLIGRKSAKNLTLSTFHGFCMRILRQEIHHLGYTRDFTLYTEKEIKRVITDLVKHMLKHENELPSLSGTIEKITDMKSRGICPTTLLKDDPKWHDKFTAELMQNMQKSMRAYNALDFDSLLSLTVELFNKHPEILAKFQDRYRYIMIDEYQDTNQVQYEITSKIAAKHGNLCVVGDDDQSIYGWRGAEIKHILQFESDHVIKLQQNYRSTKTIIEGANSVIRNNEERHDKELWSAGAPGDALELFTAPNDIEEARAVADRIVRYKTELDIPWEDIAILYRSNILARNFEQALLQATYEKNGSWLRGIPYKVFGGTEFFERSEIKDLLAYLRLIANPKDEEALLRIINVPRRGISSATLDLITSKTRAENIPLWDFLVDIASEPDKETFINDKKLTKSGKGGICGFVNLITQATERFESPPFKETLSWFLHFSHFRKSIEEEVKSEKMRQFKWENVLQVGDAIATYEEQLHEEERESDISLSDFLTSSMLDKEGVEHRREQKNFSGVNLMTFHGAKGLEFSLCFLVGLEDHIIPHEKSVEERGLEEERRLMYVAMTRAKRRLVMSMSKMRKRLGKECKSLPSRFLHEIPKTTLKITTHKLPNF